MSKQTKDAPTPEPSKAAPVESASVPQSAPKDEPKAMVPGNFFKEFAGAGTQDIADDELRPPRLSLAQSMSPEMKSTEKKYIPGLKEGDIYNNLSKEIYCTGLPSTNPIRVIIIKKLPVRGVLFAPQSEGGGIIEDGIAPTDVRMQFTTDPVSKKRMKPVATRFCEFVIFLVEQQEMMVLSMKKTQLTVGRDMASLIARPFRTTRETLGVPSGTLIPHPPAFVRMFDLRSVPDSRQNKSFANWSFSGAGATSDADLLVCSEIYKSVEKRKIKADDEVDDLPDEPSRDSVPGPDDEDAEREM